MYMYIIFIICFSLLVYFGAQNFVKVLQAFSVVLVKDEHELCIVTNTWKGNGKYVKPRKEIHN